MRIKIKKNDIATYLVVVGLYVASYCILIHPEPHSTSNQGTIYVPSWSFGSEKGKSAENSLFFKPMIFLDKGILPSRYFEIHPGSHFSIDDLKSIYESYR